MKQRQWKEVLLGCWMYDDFLASGGDVRPVEVHEGGEGRHGSAIDQIPVVVYDIDIDSQVPHLNERNAYVKVTTRRYQRKFLNINLLVRHNAERLQVNAFRILETFLQLSTDQHRSFRLPATLKVLRRQRSQLDIDVYRALVGSRQLWLLYVTRHLRYRSAKRGPSQFYAMKYACEDNSHVINVYFVCPRDTMQHPQLEPK